MKQNALLSKNYYNFFFQINKEEKKRTEVGRKTNLKEKILFPPSKLDATCLVAKLRVKGVASGI